MYGYFNIFSEILEVFWRTFLKNLQPSPSTGLLRCKMSLRSKSQLTVKAMYAYQKLSPVGLCSHLDSKLACFLFVCCENLIWYFFLAFYLMRRCETRSLENPCNLQRMLFLFFPAIHSCCQCSPAFSLLWSHFTTPSRFALAFLSRSPSLLERSVFSF